MKKWMIGIAGLLAVAIACIYIFIPARLTVVRKLPLTANSTGSFRLMEDIANWSRWWPDRSDYHITGFFYQIIYIDLGGDSTRMLISPGVRPDSSAIQWDCELSTGIDPVTRILKYRRAAGIAQEMDNRLKQMKTFFEQPKQIYGFDVYKTGTKDSVLLAMKQSFASYPTTAEIYGLYGRLRQHLSANGARQTGFPMLNVSRQADGSLQVMAALPTDKELKADPTFYSTKLVKNLFLAVDVKGGAATVELAMRSFNQYLQDYQHTVMAIPFQSLVTDRTQEPDSSKWITKIYCPVYPRD